MAVATQTKGRNLAPYHRVRHGDLQILITPALTRLASQLRISAVRRWLGRGFRVEFPDGGRCDI